VISGGLTTIAEDRYGRALTKITAEEIEALGDRDMAQILRGVPGFTVAPGGTCEFRVRGAEANASLILVDGGEVQKAAGGSYGLTSFPVSDIARIEVLRGPQSALHGSSAAAGVVAILTRGADEPCTTGQFGVEAGRWHRLGPGLNLAARSFADRRSGGFEVSNDPGGERNGRAVTAFGLKGVIAPTDWLTFGAGVQRLDRGEDHDDNANPSAPAMPRRTM
jgi:vitamin B12 transporter